MARRRLGSPRRSNHQLRGIGQAGWASGVSRMAIGNRDRRNPSREYGINMSMVLPGEWVALSEAWNNMNATLGFSCYGI